MSDTLSTSQSNKKQLPILARHAVSLSIAFALGLVLSYFAAQAIHQRIQLNKLTSPDQATFEQGVVYVITNAGQSENVTDAALEAVGTIDPQRGGDLLLAIAQSHANREDAGDPTVPNKVMQTARPLMERLESPQAIGLYDGLIQIKGIDAIHVAETLLKSVNPKDDVELLLVVDLLDTRLLWSRRWAPLDLWVRWLVVLAGSDAKLTQATTVHRLGELPEAVDDPQVLAGLSQLALSPYEEVRNLVLNAVAGYAAIAEDPTDYEQILFRLGKDENQHIARRAWMVVGHLNPLSGFAVNWRDADPYVAEAMLWAAVKTNPENPKPAMDAWTSGAKSLSALALQECYPSWRPWKTVAGKLLLESLSKAPQQESDLLWYWRTLPVLHDAWEEVVYGEARRIIFPTLFKILTPSEVRASPYRNIIEAAVYYGRVGFEPTQWQGTDNALAFAWIEGLQRGPLEMQQVDEYTYYEQVGRLLTTFEIENFKEDNGVLDRDIVGRFSVRTQNHYGQHSSMLAAAGSDHPIYAETKPLSDITPDEAALNFWVAINVEQARNRASNSGEPSKPPHIEGYSAALRGHSSRHIVAASLYAVMIGDQPTLIGGVNAAFLRKNPSVDVQTLRKKSDKELTELGLQRVDALIALQEAAAAAPPSANRAIEAKLLKLALWMRGDLGDGFTPTAESMLFDKDMPTSTVLMCLLHMKRPAALDYLFGDLATQRPDLHQLFVQERFWHVFRRFIDTSDLTLWLWGDPAAQGFQLEAMRQWYAVHRWQLEEGWWPEAGTSSD